MKTALQELIEYIQGNVNDCEEYGLLGRGFYLDCKFRAEDLLLKEQKQIEESFNKGKLSSDKELINALKKILEHSDKLPSTMDWVIGNARNIINESEIKLL